MFLLEWLLFQVDLTSHPGASAVQITQLAVQKAVEPLVLVGLALASILQSQSRLVPAAASAAAPTEGVKKDLGDPWAAVEGSLWEG